MRFPIPAIICRALFRLVLRLGFGTLIALSWVKEAAVPATVDVGVTIRAGLRAPWDYWQLDLMIARIANHLAHKTRRIISRDRDYVSSQNQNRLKRDPELSGPALPMPPQMNTSPREFQTPVWNCRAAGALLVGVDFHASFAGSYRPPVRSK